MTKSEHTVSIEVEVIDSDALYQAALAHMVTKDGLPEEEAVDMLKPGGEIDMSACLIAIFDPGMSPPGTQINNSSVETHHQ